MSATILLPESWCLSGRLTARLAARRDAGHLYATASVRLLVEQHLLPPTHNLKYGDAVASLTEGQLVMWFINRRHGRTLAALLPEGLPRPERTDAPLLLQEYDVFMIGPVRGGRLLSPTYDESGQIWAGEVVQPGEGSELAVPRKAGP